MHTDEKKECFGGFFGGTEESGVQDQSENNKCFWEAMSGNDRPGHAVYRELVLTDSEESSRKIKYFRPRSWAVCAVRIEQVPLTQDEALALADSTLLLLVCVTSGPGQHRYDRVIVLQRGERDNVKGLLEFFRKWLPQLVEERRVFLATVPEDLRDSEVERAIGAADPIDCP